VGSQIHNEEQENWDSGRIGTRGVQKTFVQNRGQHQERQRKRHGDCNDAIEIKVRPKNEFNFQG